MGSDKKKSEESNDDLEPAKKADTWVKLALNLVTDARALILATAALGSLGLSFAKMDTNTNDVKVNATYETMREQIIMLRERVAKLEAITEEHLGRPVRVHKLHNGEGFGSGAGRLGVSHVDVDGVADEAPSAPGAPTETVEDAESEEAVPELPSNLDSLVQQKTK